MELLFFGLMAFLVLGSLLALEMRNLLSAVIAVGVVGLGLSILFLLLGAPDIAITQVVVEVIVVTILIRTAARTDARGEGPRRGLPGVAAGVLLALLLLALALPAFAALPAFGEPAMTVSRWYVENGPEKTGATNIVTAILLDFRGYDTLGEATVILTAILGVLAVLRHQGRRRHRASDETPRAARPCEVVRD